MNEDPYNHRDNSYFRRDNVQNRHQDDGNQQTATTAPNNHLRHAAYSRNHRLPHNTSEQPTLKPPRSYPGRRDNAGPSSSASNADYSAELSRPAHYFNERQHVPYNNYRQPTSRPKKESVGQSGYHGDFNQSRFPPDHNLYYEQAPLRPPRGYAGQSGYPGETNDDMFPPEHNPLIPHTVANEQLTPRLPIGYSGRSDFPGESVRPNISPEQKQHFHMRPLDSSSSLPHYYTQHAQEAHIEPHYNMGPSDNFHTTLLHTSHTRPTNEQLRYTGNSPQWSAPAHGESQQNLRARTQHGHDHMQHGHDHIQPGHDHMKHGRDHMEYGRDFMQHGRDFMQHGRDFMPHGRDFMPHGRDYMPHGRDYMPHGHDHMQHGYDQKEHDQGPAPSEWGDRRKSREDELTNVQHSDPGSPASASVARSVQKLWPDESAKQSSSSFRASSGRRRALLVGINYSGFNELHGCVRDVEFMAYLLRSRFGFRSEDLFVMTDEPHKIENVHSGKPTRKQMLEAMDWLVRGADRGDSLFFYFSGHGGSVPDEDGDEADGFDETICPVDFLENGMITDDELYDILVRRVPRGARLTAVMDSCHSGTGMDLPYIYDVATGTMQDDRLEGFPEKESKVKRVLQRVGLRKKALPRQPRPDSKGGEVLLISGCRDHEYSSEDDILAGVPTGAMTFCLVEAIEKGEKRDWREYNYQSLLIEMKEKLDANRMDQTPQFSTSHPFNLLSPFVI